MTYVFALQVLYIAAGLTVLLHLVPGTQVESLFLILASFVALWLLFLNSMALDLDLDLNFDCFYAGAYGSEPQLRAMQPSCT